jgi:hypothetical protein
LPKGNAWIIIIKRIQQKSMLRSRSFLLIWSWNIWVWLIN